MTTDLIAQYLDLVLNGASPDDPGLDALLVRMTPEEVQQVQATLIAKYIKTLPPPQNAGAPAPPDATKLDFVGLAIEFVRRGARPGDARIEAMLAAMSRDELQRGRRAIGELWLQAEPITGWPN